MTKLLSLLIKYIAKVLKKTYLKKYIETFCIFSTKYLDETKNYYFLDSYI